MMAQPYRYSSRVIWTAAAARIELYASYDRSYLVEIVGKPLLCGSPDAHFCSHNALRERAHGECFLANFVNFPVRHVPVVMAHAAV